MTLPCTTVELRVYDRDGATLRDTVAATTGAQWTDLLGDVGSASLSVPLVQAIMQTNPALLDNAIIKVATNLTAGSGTLTEIFGFLAEGGQFTLIGENEDADKSRSLQCRGLLALVDDWIVYPEAGLHAHSGDQRAFGWMSKTTSHSFDLSQWIGTIHGTAWKDVSSSSDRYHLPKGWPDPLAQWVGTNGKEKQYFRTTLTVADDTPVRVFASADENLRVYLDSELIISNDSNEIGYTELNHWRGILTAGTHTFGVYYLKVYNPPTWGTGWDLTDADKMIFTCCSLKRNGDIDQVLRRSNDTNWKAVGLDDGVRPPTWSAAGIVRQLVDEARARGVDSASRINVSGFTKTTDSDGVTWPDLHERQWPIGAKGTQVLTDLAALDVDFDMLPNLHLNAYATQGQDVSATVALQKGVNILSYKVDDVPILATTLLVRTHNRWLEVTDTASEAVNDRREAFLETGGSISRDQGKHVANRALDDFARERHSYTAEIIAVTGCVPYLDFGKGDTLMAYDTALAATPLQVVSISGSTPDEGPIRWTIELEEP